MAETQTELIQRLMAQMASGQVPNDIPGLRKLLDEMSPLLNADPPKVGAVHDAVSLRPGVTADVLVPDRPGPHPVLVYLHGGGWVAGSPKSHRKLGLRFAEAGFLVVNVDYRLAPEAPFPGPFDDCAFAVRWAAQNAGRFGGDASRLAVGGDSAGGNLSAAVVAHLAGDPTAPRIRATLLIYGVFDFAAFELSSGHAPTPQEEIAARLRDAMVDAYLGAKRDPSLVKDPRVSPLRAAAKLPPSFLVVGTADPLLDQQKALAAELARAAVPHESLILDGMPHGFVQYEFLPQARETIAKMAAFLERNLR